jgi:phosphoglycerate dehydrogenase-like enzyme
MENVICLTQREIETFLPNGQFEQAKSLLGPTTYFDPDSFSNEEEWSEKLRECNPEILIAAWQTPSLPENLKEFAPRLKYVCYLPGSIRKLVPRSAIENGLLVSSWGSSISRTISECALLMTLCCMRRVNYWTIEMHNHKGWKNAQTETQSLFERRVGLHGLGLISQKLVELLKPFGNKISAFSPSVSESIYNDLGVSRANSLEELFSQNDVVVELAALTPLTKGIVTEELLRMIPEGGAFVNVGRGAVVDEDALARLASDRPDLQIALDVYGVEPLPVDSVFRGMRNVLLLPHLGGPTIDRRCDAGVHGLANLQRYLNGEDLVDGYDLSLYDRAT